MSVIRTSETPDRSKIMTLTDVCDFQWDVIRHWKKRTDVWSFTMGLGLLAGSASLSSMWIGEKLRYMYKVSKKNTVLVVLPLFVIPPCLTYTLQTMYVIPDLFLLDLYECLLCPMVKSAATQVATSVAYPVLAGNLISWGTLYKEAAVIDGVPHYTEYMKTVKFLYQRTRPLFPRLAILFFAQVILSQGVTYYQYEQLMRIKGYTILMEEEEKEQRSERRRLLLEKDEELKKRRMAEIEEQESKMAAMKERKEEFAPQKPNSEEAEKSYG